MGNAIQQPTLLGPTNSMAADAGIPTFETEIEQRIAYAEALTMGKTIFEWAGNSPAAGVRYAGRPSGSGRGLAGLTVAQRRSPRPSRRSRSGRAAGSLVAPVSGALIEPTVARAAIPASGHAGIPAFLLRRAS